MKRKDTDNQFTSTTTSVGGMGFVGWLTLAFIVLKLTGYIGWSWWWVLSPLWISFGIVLVLWIVIFLVLALTNGN